ncbi:MAG: hypothetical protein A2315_04565 [Ignavibacteria bacterium RIFOXYB2_FULL_35_12]|nr:MAG: hypothetical protein A2058_01630 [Ignavibacteria bacterium GWA2_36_19]OGU52514.1 MAG: hypothetical protein A2006_12970 [Ignavibacteria bacterium GWC2_35_8]OGU56597.1 MAG: hypothetical protein A2X60_05805 [Ignavibacteria bacterium GWF2_35_20]OGU81373.1 MAG: hypothetical protein A2254_03635 [Ignavibacteria bacterium RIFOXYA2_FULL_35_9]OGU87737.1 MAG: hypothetical protein A2492_12225 [Ignavibacteria bacterium RIFOXYC12_FULL_35_11]OGU87941.1 MAG: hypothetical protein A3K31_06105 [Ignavibac
MFYFVIMMKNDYLERMNMYWVEEPNKAAVSELSNSQILENLAYAGKRFEYLYCRELRKLEQVQSKAIIKNLEEFKTAQTKYFQIKGMHPKIWFENWDVYKEIIQEAGRRNLALAENEMNGSEKTLCFG